MLKKAFKNLANRWLHDLKKISKLIAVNKSTNYK